jgi:hypothetical protein
MRAIKKDPVKAKGNTSVVDGSNAVLMLIHSEINKEG